MVDVESTRYQIRYQYKVTNLLQTVSQNFFSTVVNDLFCSNLLAYIIVIITA